MQDMNKEKKEQLKQLIKDLHENKTPEIRAKFKSFLASLTPSQIARVEEELIDEGMDPREIYSMCDIHLELFKDALKDEEDIAPVGHPVNILMSEHKKMIEFSDDLHEVIQDLKKVKGFPFAANLLAKVQDIVHHLKEAEKHYLREENVLFPYLEKHGVVQPPKIMWMDHDQIRTVKKRIVELVEDRPITDYNLFIEELEKATISLAELQNSHFTKENKILFPTGLQVINGDEWNEIRKEFDEIGYCCFTPKVPEVESKQEKGSKKVKTEDEEIVFETGSMKPEILERVLDSLPIDITFVDKHDRVKYFSNNKDRIFVRSKAIIGRTVQNCHPQKSVHIVNEIVNAFKDGSKDMAEFWLPLGEVFAHIRYYAIRDKDGEYLGTLEVSQDIDPIKQIEGQKRLLDWED